MRYDEETRNARLNQVAAKIGGGGMLRIFSGEERERCEAADPPGMLAEIELPDKPFRDADGGVLLMSAPWTGHGAHDAGKGTLANSFRVYDALGNCRMEGTVTAHEDGGDLLLDNPSIAAGQKIVIGGFTFRELGAT
jgi:hypothetical protein